MLTSFLCCGACACDVGGDNETFITNISFGITSILLMEMNHSALLYLESHKVHSLFEVNTSENIIML